MVESGIGNVCQNCAQEPRIPGYVGAGDTWQIYFISAVAFYGFVSVTKAQGPFMETSKEARKQASKEASKEAGKETRTQGSKEAGQQGSKEARKQLEGSKEARKLGVNSEQCVGLELVIP